MLGSCELTGHVSALAVGSGVESHHDLRKVDGRARHRQAGRDHQAAAAQHGRQHSDRPVGSDPCTITVTGQNSNINNAMRDINTIINDNGLGGGGGYGGGSALSPSVTHFSMRHWSAFCLSRPA